MAKSREKSTADSLSGRNFEVIQVLSDTNRIRILRLLSEEGELCAQDILTHFPITQPTLSHHMNVLLDNRLVDARKSGRRVFYSVSRKGLQDIIGFFSSLLENQAAESVTKAEKIDVLPGIEKSTGKEKDIPKEKEKNYLKEKEKNIPKDKEKSGKKDKKKKKKKKT
jgi:ArsR family transcriptional regulator, arsenate/arsenite/antimonite-responsive transcriptional repressor